MTNLAPHQLEQLAAAARTSVTRAALVCRRVQARLDEVRAATKDDRSPVTVADFASQAVVCLTLEEVLGGEFSQAGMVAEEDADFLVDPSRESYLHAAVDAARAAVPDLSAERFLRALSPNPPEGTAFWTLDPIDGTKGFLRGQQYAIALAFVAEGTPVVGAVGAPNLPLDPEAPIGGDPTNGSLYVATAGGGVRASECVSDAEDQPLPKLGPLTGAIRVCASVEKAHSNVSNTDRVIRAVEANTDVLRLDSSAKYVVVARGQADAYLRLPTSSSYIERIWDHAAGCIVATEAGVSVSDVDGKKLDFGHGRGLEKNRGVVVCHPDAQSRLLTAIRELSI